MLLLPTLLSGCLIDTALYERRKAELTDHDGDGFAQVDECDDTDAAVFPGAEERCDGVDEDCDGAVDEDAADVTAWFEDADGDGHGNMDAREWACNAPPGFVASDDDCDDAAEATYPEAPDAWYDGVDANCDGADDSDADADGDRAEAAGGTDCDDADPAIAGTRSEGWADAGVDNDCDGSIEDQARAELDDLGVRIDGTAADGALGISLQTLPAGWADPEAVLLVAAPFAGTGDIYGWRASDLAASPSLGSAPWHLTGADAGDYAGYGLGWAGDAATPLVLIGSEGAQGTRGQVDVWAGARLDDAPILTIVGETVGSYFGAQAVSGYDHDGDGVADLVVTAQLDSRVAANGGAAFVFLAPAGLSGEVSVSDADVEFTTTYAGALLSVDAVGDVDGDGGEDLGFDLRVSLEEGPGGLLVSGGAASGTHDVLDASFAQFYAAGNAFSAVTDWDGDGIGELLVASGGLERYVLPLAGALTPWDDAASRLAFTDPADTVTGLRGDVDGYAGHAAFLLASSSFDSGRGGVFVHAPLWADGMAAEAGRFAAVGAAGGDAAGSALELIDVDLDGIEDLVVGAPGADAGGVGSGAIYVVPGPR